MTRICFVSDLHTDMGSQPGIQWPEADVLVIAGDTANSIGEVQKFVQKNQKRWSFDELLFVDGNHEHYSNAPQGRTILDTIGRIGELVPELTMLPLVDYHKVGNLYFIGRNGWYSVDAAGDPEANKIRWREVMNDNRWVGFDQLNIAPPWERAITDAGIVAHRIQSVLHDDPSAKFVIVTHTAPCRETLSQLPQHLLDNSFYANLHMERVMERYRSCIVAWCHGHTHYRQEKLVHGIPVIVNPRGYPGENPSWEPVVYDL